jgi:hypothetical protein
MIGREDQAPRVGGQEKELEANGPLERGNRIPVSVLVRHHTATGLELDVDVRPFPATALVQQVFDRRVGRDRGRRPEHDLPDVAADVLVRVDILDDLARGRSPPSVRRLPVAMKLEVCEMRAPPVERGHRRERRR